MTTRSNLAEPTHVSKAGARRYRGSKKPEALGFTLIEMMAVVLIMGLMLSLIAPNLRFGGATALREAAVEVSQRLELTRQLAVTSGKPHRLLVDLENSEYRIEAFLPVEQDLPLGGSAAPSASLVDLRPPNDEAAEYQPLSNRFGAPVRLDSDFFFEGLETAEGWFDEGLVALVFEWDGTTDAAELIIGDRDGRAVALEVRPILDRVSVRDEKS